jgi:hypothetical protein
VRRIVHLRWKKRLGPVAIADRLGLAPSTVHAVLRRCRINESARRKALPAWLHEYNHHRASHRDRQPPSHHPLDNVSGRYN